jgi:hypothetical protein
MRRLSVISILTAIIVTTVAVGAQAAARQSAPPTPPAAPAPPSFEQGQVPPPPAAPTQAPKPGTVNIPIATPAQAPQAPQGGQQPQPPTPPPAKPLDPAQMVNIRVELAITETHGSNAPSKKTVFLLTRSDSRASVRSNMVVGNTGMGLNVDIRPRVERDGRISLNLTFNYVPELSGESAPGVNRPPDLNETMEVFLVDGKPLLISQSADPKGDRKVTVEVTATVVK